MKTSFIIILFVFIVFIQACGGSSGGGKNLGFLALQFNEHNDFNPNAAPGVIDNFKITVSGEGLDTPIVHYYAANTQTVQLDGFADGAQIEINVEAYNQNGFVIRRGYSEPISITSGQVSQAVVEIYNVPIFTNVKPSGYINVDRFVPKVFAPGQIEFELSDTFDAVTTSLSDVLTDQITLSISDDLFFDSTMPIHVTPLAVGEHTLRVEDPQTHEATDVNVTGYKSVSRKVLTTTAGAYLGVMGRGGENGSNLGTYMQTMTENGL